MRPGRAEPAEPAVRARCAPGARGVGCGVWVRPRRRPRRRVRGYPRRVHALEVFFLVLLIAVSIVIAWFAGFVVYRLYKGQR